MVKPCVAAAAAGAFAVWSSESHLWFLLQVWNVQAEEFKRNDSHLPRIFYIYYNV